MIGQHQRKMLRTKQGIICILVARGGIEPPTQGFSTRSAGHYLILVARGGIDQG